MNLNDPDAPCISDEDADANELARLIDKGCDAFDELHAKQLGYGSRVDREVDEVHARLGALTDEIRSLSCLLSKALHREGVEL